MPWKRDNRARAIRRATLAQRRAVHATAEVVLDASRSEVPHDEGTLSDSGLVVLAPGITPEAAITYGGGAGTGLAVVPYAIRWHEEQANFQKGRKSRYLADPFARLAQPTLQKTSEAEMRKEGF